MFRIFFLLFFVATAASAADNDADILKNVDIFQMEVASDPQISPDGSTVAYVRRSMDIMSDRPVSNIWVVGYDSSGHRPLLSGSDSYSSPRWSPSGNRIAYISNVHGHGAQIHVRWMDTGQTALLTNVRNSPGSVSWSPDGKTIAFSMFVESKSPPLAPPPSAPKGADWAPPVRVIESMPYRSGGRYFETGNDHIFLLSAEGGTPRQITSGDYDHDGQLSWTPDGKNILFAATRKEDAEHDPVEAEIWSVSVADGAMTRLTDRDGPDFGAVIAPDGSKIAYLGFDDKKMGYHNTNV